MRIDQLKISYQKMRRGRRGLSSPSRPQQVPRTEISHLMNKDYQRLGSGIPANCKTHGYHFKWSLTATNKLKCQECTRQGTIRQKLGSAKSRRPNSFNLTVSDIEARLKTQKNLCALTGQAFNSIKDISIDRIDSSKGYHIDNIQLVTKQVNVCKWTLSNQAFINMCQQVTKFAETGSLKELSQSVGATALSNENLASIPLLASSSHLS